MKRRMLLLQFLARYFRDSIVRHLTSFRSAADRARAHVLGRIVGFKLDPRVCLVLNFGNILATSSNNNPDSGFGNLKLELTF